MLSLTLSSRTTLDVLLMPICLLSYSHFILFFLTRLSCRNEGKKGFTMYRRPDYPPERKKQGIFLLLFILAGIVFLVVWSGLHQPLTTANSTYTIVTPDDSSSSSTGSVGSSTNTLYARDGSPLPTMVPTAKLHSGVNGNPWGYDFNAIGGHLLYSPVPGFCAGQYFQCVSDFWERSNGYVVECHSGYYSHSGGVQGACSQHGGVWRALYSH